MRAMFRVKEGTPDEAWHDLLACHRLARLCDQGSFIVDGLVAVKIDMIAQTGDRLLVEHGGLTSDQIAKMRTDFNALPAMTSVAGRLDRVERLSLLNVIVIFARDGISSVNDVEQMIPKGRLGAIIDSLVASAVNWDIPLRIANSWCDRSVAVTQCPATRERSKAIKELEVALHEICKVARDPKSIGWSLLASPRKDISERLGNFIVGMLLPIPWTARDAEDRARMQNKLTDVAFALAAYRADRDSYPPKLAALVPKYMPKLPKDLFNNDADLHYLPTGDGYLLYSVGINGKDDGGRGEDDRKHDEGWDDLIVRVPSRAD
jgi:hypothetical protein